MIQFFQKLFIGIATAFLVGATAYAITPFSLFQGGTGASTASDARTNLGLGTIATQNAGTLTNTKYCTYSTTSGFVCNSEGTGSMTYPGAGVAVSDGGAWTTSLSTDGSGDCGSGAACLGGHTHSSYLTSLTGAVLTDQTVGQTIGADGARLTKLWATDITVTNAIAGAITGNAGTASALAADPADCAAGTAATAIAASGALTCGITPLISGGTLTSSNICQYDGTGIDCNLTADGTAACAAGSVCTGGHTHATSEISGVNAGTDLTADLEEEAHAAEHAVSAADTVFPADPNADRYLQWDDDSGVLVWAAGAGGLASTDIDTSAELLAIVGDETGSASGTPLLVFNTNPILTGATLAGILADNDDMVFEADADNNGSNKFSFTDGASGEIASITEAGLLTVADDIVITGSDLSLGAAGVKLTGDGDGAITFLGLGNGFDEDFTFNLDDVENTLTLSSSTGLATIDFGSMALTIGEGKLADSTIVSADIKNGTITAADTAITAGRSLTWATDDLAADAELYTDWKGITIETPTDADNFFLFEAPIALTITRVTGIVEAATSAVLTVQECDSAGDNCSTVESVTADVDGTISTSIDNDSIDAGDIVRVDVGTVTGTVGQAHVTVTFTKND